MVFTYRCLVYAERIWWHPGEETTIMTPPKKNETEILLNSPKNETNWDTIETLRQIQYSFIM